MSPIPRSYTKKLILLSMVLLLTLGRVTPVSYGGELAGISIVPHRVDTTLQYRRPHDPNLAARVQMFVKGPAEFKQINDKSPEQLLAAKAWAWHDLQNAPPIPAGALSVWNFNGLSSDWGIGKSFQLSANGLEETAVSITEPQAWISSVTFLRSGQSTPNVIPNQMVLFLQNNQDQPLDISEIRFWLPKDGTTWRTLWPQKPFAHATTIPAREKACITVDTVELPLTYAAIEVVSNSGKLWSYLRVKREAFDISGGWVFDSKESWRELTATDPTSGKTTNSFLDLLSSLHINTAHYQEARGYSDTLDLVERNPLKRFAKLWPASQWESKDQLSTVHAVEFLGEPQYGGGKPVPPQEVYDQLLPYRESQLPTSVTHSEERIWRFYAGLSDYPHFDAYRVVAPAADAWRKYDRWDGQQISWGAPLETIGNLCRSQRELNRPMPCAVWSQGPHDGWGGGFSLLGRRARRSPTADELRAQAMHALASRVTSLYWFNLSRNSLEKFPDTWEPMRRIGREIRMLEDIYLRSDAYEFSRQTQADGKADWELSSLITADSMVLFAIDTNYTISPEKQEFIFGAPRPTQLSFKVPSWLAQPLLVRRVDADGLHPVVWTWHDQSIQIEDSASRDRIYVVAQSEGTFKAIESKRTAALEHEKKYLPTALRSK
jgi:hypothetical protein